MSDHEIRELLTSQRVWNYDRHNVGQRDIEFLPDGNIGKGEEKYEQRWEVKNGRLFVYGPERVTMVLVPKSGGFSGRWAIYDQNSVVITPVDRFGARKRVWTDHNRNFYQPHHLRACAYQIHYMRKLANLYPGARLRLYVNPHYLRELKRHVDTPQIELLDFRFASDSAINCCIDNWRFREFHQTPGDYIGVYVDFFKALSEEISMTCPINQPEDMLFDHPRIVKSNELSGPIDYLIVNSEGMSGQVENVQDLLDAQAKRLAKNGYRVVTTRRVDGIPCTLDFDLGLLDIGNLATTSEVIAGVNTGPMVTCFNAFNQNYVKKWVIIDARDHFNFNNRIVKVGSRAELQRYEI